MKRRDVLKSAGLAMLAFNGLNVSFAGSDKPWKINVFSKHLHWAGYDDMARIASSIGFDGVDLTVRKNGHVEPERVEKELPLAVEACNKHKVSVEMMTTEITTAGDPNTEKILRTAAGLGVKVYRMGWYKYDLGISIEKNIENFSVELQRIAELNAKYNIVGDYQNHSGMSGGSPVWDINTMLQKAPSDYLGVQYDIRHAMIEGLYSWELGLRLLAPKIHSIDIKDFEYEKTEKGWGVKNVPLGQGAVDFRTYFKLLDSLEIRVPLSIHFEYPLGGADHGDKTLTIPREKVIEVMSRDLQYLKSVLQS